MRREECWQSWRDQEPPGGVQEDGHSCQELPVTTVNGPIIQPRFYVIYFVESLFHVCIYWAWLEFTDWLRVMHEVSICEPHSEMKQLSKMKREMEQSRLSYCEPSYSVTHIKHPFSSIY